MNFIIEPFQPTARYASASAIMNALQFYGMNIGVWNRQKPFLDMIDETNPAAIFTFGISDREKKYSDEKMIRVVNINDIINYIPDILLYNPATKHEYFKTDCICMASYVDVDSVQNPFLDSMLSTTRSDSFKFFTVAYHPKSYGALPQNLYGVALASADSVLALSEVGKVNGMLCNDNVRLRNYQIDAIEELRPQFVHSSNLFAAEEYLPLGIDVSEVRNKFLSQAFGCTF